MIAHRSPALAFALIACGTGIGIAGTDLVLPAVPILPAQLGGSAEQAQLVLAAFTAGAALGLVIFGELGARFDPRRLLTASLLGYGLASLACGFSVTLQMLIALRFVQGAAGAAAAVFAPGMLRALYGDERAVRALGALGSIEALAPALAPIAGTALLHLWGWRAGFDMIGGFALLLAATIAWRPQLLPEPNPQPRQGSYVALLRNRAFVGQALGYALTLAGLLVFVFGAPAVFTHSLGLGLDSFIILQMCGIACFAVAANLAARLTSRFGATALIWSGSLLCAAGALALLAYAATGGTTLVAIVGLSALINFGFGLRGPPGFHAAIVAAGGDDARASALVVLAMLAAAAAGTALVAPFIGDGLPAIAGGAAGGMLAGLLALAAVPRERAAQLKQRARVT